MKCIGRLLGVAVLLGLAFLTVRDVSAVGEFPSGTVRGFMMGVLFALLMGHFRDRAEAKNR